MGENKTLHNWREGRYIKRWLNKKGINYIKRHQNNINLIVDEYEKELIINVKCSFSSAERYKLIKEVIEFQLTVRPEYNRLLKQAGFKDSDIGFSLGYKNSQSWADSYKRAKIISTILKVHNQANNNPAFNPIK